MNRYRNLAEGKMKRFLTNVLNIPNLLKLIFKRFVECIHTFSSWTIRSHGTPFEVTRRYVTYMFPLTYSYTSLSKLAINN